MSEELKIKHNESLKLYEKMTSNLPHKRPKCEEILERKNWWALNEEEFEINEFKKEFILKLNDENFWEHTEDNEVLSPQSTKFGDFLISNNIKTTIDKWK